MSAYNYGLGGATSPIPNLEKGVYNDILKRSNMFPVSVRVDSVTGVQRILDNVSEAKFWGIIVGLGSGSEDASMDYSRVHFGALSGQPPPPLVLPGGLGSPPSSPPVSPRSFETMVLPGGLGSPPVSPPTSPRSLLIMPLPAGLGSPPSSPPGSPRGSRTTFIGKVSPHELRPYVRDLKDRTLLNIRTSGFGIKDLQTKPSFWVPGYHIARDDEQDPFMTGGFGSGSAASFGSYWGRNIYVIENQKTAVEFLHGLTIAAWALGTRLSYMCQFRNLVLPRFVVREVQGNFDQLKFMLDDVGVLGFVNFLCHTKFNKQVPVHVFGLDDTIDVNFADSGAITLWEHYRGEFAGTFGKISSELIDRMANRNGRFARQDEPDDVIVPGANPNISYDTRMEDHKGGVRKLADSDYQIRIPRNCLVRWLFGAKCAAVVVGYHGDMSAVYTVRSVSGVSVPYS